ncbi:MAG: phosphoribosylformylglycinamidine synthase subunit PurQ, partial [Clostridia bacterium]|nr:phosphoribosylformylglycinamidine synthase subunit PurQ [Clostridia bacterium]
GFACADDVPMNEIFGYNYGAFILELNEDIEVGEYLGVTMEENAIFYGDKCIKAEDLQKIYEDKLEKVYSCNIKQGSGEKIEAFSYAAENRVAPAIKVARPKVLIPVFPGTNCEFDTAKVMRDAGAEPEIFVIKNLTSKGIADSVSAFAEKVKESQIIFIPGGFSGGDEPDGSGKFITAFFRAGAVKEQVNELLKNRDGLMCGICNGFQAIIKLGLVPYGEIIDTDENCPTLTFNTISRHQSRMVQTRIASNKSPWLAATNVGDVYNVPISHGEGKFLCDMELVKKLAANGQIATQYVDLDGNPTSDILFNPNDSVCAIEGITSPDGRVFGKMGHSERTGAGLYKNVAGNYDMKMFDSAVKYFK